MEKEGISGKIVYNKKKSLAIPVHEVHAEFCQGPQGTSWLIRGSAGSEGDSLMQMGPCLM